MQEFPQSSALAEPRAQTWPTEDLDVLGACPVCNSPDRSLLHADLVDNTFFCAPGRWTLWRCAACRSAYLDPRPTRETIGKAYASYYTHLSGGEAKRFEKLRGWKSVRRRLLNGYLNRRFGGTFAPASRLGAILAWLYPRIRTQLEHEYRNLPAVPAGGGRLLDIGCGNGAFLARAQACGWEVEGVDPDPAAIAAAGRRGIAARLGGLEHFADASAVFDVITLNHVIEHVHDPAATLQSCFRLLRPGGTIWVETPNVDAQGHRLFGPAWRGLETPRHLILFNRASLDTALRVAGFRDVRDRIRASACPSIFRASQAIRTGSPPDHRVPMRLGLRLRRRIAPLVEALRPQMREFITVSAMKTIA